VLLQAALLSVVVVSVIVCLLIVRLLGSSFAFFSVGCAMAKNANVLPKALAYQFNIFLKIPITLKSIISSSYSSISSKESSVLKGFSVIDL